MIYSSAAVAPAPRNTGAGDTIAYTAPFLVFIASLAFQHAAPGAVYPFLVARIVLVLVILATVSRRVIPLRPAMPAGSVLVGVAVFAVWVGPELLWPGYRGHWLFENAITGAARSSIPIDLRSTRCF